MAEAIPIAPLIDRVLAELQRLHYAPQSIVSYRRYYHRLLRYAEAEGVGYYSDAFGRQFFAARNGFAWPEGPQPIPRKYRWQLRFLAVLSDMQLHGTIVRRHSYQPAGDVSESFRDILTAFQTECQRRGYSLQGERTRQARIRHFVGYLAMQSILPAQLNATHLSRYVATLVDYHPKTVLAILTSLRTFLRFLHEAGFHAEDLSAAVPRVRAGRYDRLPSVWPADAVQRLLEVVDRGNPTGKRDYAILLLAARLGMRVGDIKALTLSALHWDRKTIQWVQQKTGRPIEYPLLEDVGWALIDYLRHGRPATTSPEIFVRHQAPFEPFGRYANLHTVITKYARQAGLTPPPGHHGLHALRHSLASTLLEHDTPLPVIAEILGHLSTQSTQVYLAIDQAGLTRCALNPEAVFDYADH
ncbi:MAG: site-specific integrase [Firmicutes bacterium]|nr:site-specific integrase [Bacillota bacterium]